jgi:TonB family protein
MAFVRGWGVMIAAVGLAAGCGKSPPAAEGPYAIPVDVVADTGRTQPLHVVAPDAPRPRAAVWLARVSPARPAALAIPPVDVVSETLAVSPEPPSLAVDEGLKPPIPRTRAPLRVPPGARGFVELDVQVDESGRVADALWAAGQNDRALVRAAIECARRMEFYPALRAGRPVSVWCRQRFEFSED